MLVQRVGSAETDPANWMFLQANERLSLGAIRSVAIRDWHYTELDCGRHRVEGACRRGAVVKLADTRVLEALARKSVPVRPRAAPPAVIS